MSNYTYDDLKSRYEDMTSRITVACQLTTRLVGGQPATKEGVQAFVTHHLKLTGPEAEAAVSRILQEEVGEKDVPEESGGELKEKLSYGINVVRSNGFGPYLGDWMIKANLKAAASRIALFTTKRGTKGDMAEMGQARAVGASLQDAEHPNRIYLVNETENGPAHTYFDRFRGRIQSPQGSKSIVSDNQCVAEGSRFSFEFRFYAGKIKEKDALDMMAASMVIGLGSAKAFECGKFKILTMGFEAGNPREKGETA